MLTTLTTIAIVALLFGLTIFVHELGHFLAARACGLVVETFSIGFGPALWKRRINGVVYKIGAIPFGGYVALPQLDPTGMSLVQGPAEGGADAAAPAAEAPRVLPAISPWKRIVVSAAGAAGNVVLAVILAWVVFLVGKPATPAEESAVVGYVARDSEAYAAGLRIGDEVVSVNREPVANWLDFMMVCARFETVTAQVRRGGETLALTFPGERSIGQLDGRSLCMVLAVEPGMSAHRAGLQRGDIIVAFADQEVVSRAQLIALVADRKGQTAPIVIRRNDERLTLAVTPDYDEATRQVRIGVQFNVNDVDFDRTVHPRPWQQLKSHSQAIFRVLQALVTPSQAKATSKQIGGPLAILISYYYIVRASLMVAVFFTCFLNVNLAILNLLPIPVLDGGHILFSLWEAVFRRPAHPRIITGATNLFATLLIALFVFLTGRDLWRFTPVGRWVNGWFGTNAPAVEAVAPPAATNTAEAAPAP